MKEKKLGIIHILCTYIWLPLVIIGYTYELIRFCVFLFADIRNNFSLDVIPYIMLIIAVLISAAGAFISMVQQNKVALLLLKFLLILYTAECLFRCIILVQTATISWVGLLVAMLIPVTIMILLWLYYSKRSFLLDNPRMGSIIRDLSEYLCAILGLFMGIIALIIEVYSIYWMFQTSVGDGLFGIFVPVIAQLVFLFRTGFTSAYANLIYGLLIIAGSSFAIGSVMGYTEEQQNKAKVSEYRDNDIGEQQCEEREADEKHKKIAELQIELTEISALSHRMKNTLETARIKFGNMTVHDINVMFENKTITDTEARDLITHLTDARKIIEQYPDMIEKIDRRCAELNEQIKFLKGEIRY